MSLNADLLLLLVIGIDLFIGSTGRLGARIRACALQGLVLAALPLAIQGTGVLTGGERVLHTVLAVLATLLLKAVAIPYFLLRAMRQSGVQREAEPEHSLHLSLLLCAVLVGLSFWISAVMLPPPEAGSSPLGVPAGLATLLVGLYLTVGGRTELTQVIGYLVLENGVFVIGQRVLGEFPLVVELGVLLDVLVAVMLMAVLVAFEHRQDEASVGNRAATPAGGAR
jgi:hydrogenase-4 component E